MKTTYYLSKIYHKLRRLPGKGLRRFTVSKKPAADAGAYIENYRFFEMPGKHIFFGYYDIPQINGNGTKLLALTADKKADPAFDAADVGYFDLYSGVYTKLTSTRAWCMQQGSRLRWHPSDPAKFLFNDIDGDTYTAKICDIGSGTGTTAVIAPALYDISGDFRYGVSVNFARLQRLRPGYGYSVLPDKTKGNPAPEDDGVFLADLAAGSSNLIVSLRELALADDKELTGEHYINHVSFSPGGTGFIFFHIVKNSGKNANRTIKLYLYNIGSETLTLLESERATSHYCWRGPNELLTTSGAGKMTEYMIYDLGTGKKRILGHDSLRQDGHPSMLSNGNAFISDTYPDKAGYQKLFYFDMERNSAVILAEFYHKPVKYNEMRCDLHPRLWDNGSKQIITLDTTYSGGVRKVFMADLVVGKV